MDKLIAKFRMRGKSPRRVNPILKNKVGEPALPDFKIHYSLQETRHSGTSGRTDKYLSRTQQVAQIQILPEMAKLQHSDMSTSWGACGANGAPFMAGGNTERGSPFVL